MSARRINRQSGMSLVEVMVAVVILASGLLGLAALQAKSLLYSQSSFYRSVAADLASDLADRIRANRPPYIALGEDGVTRPSALAATPNFASCVQDTSDLSNVTGCPTTFLVAAEVLAWNTALRNQLVNGRWTLSSVAAGQGFRYTLTITWLDDRSNSADSSFVAVIE